MSKTIVYTNAKFYTLNESFPEANSLAIEHGEIIDVGFNLEDKYFNAKIHDLNGKVALPGFIDAHIHLEWLVYSKYYWVNLKNVKSFSELKNVLRKHMIRTKHFWIIGRGFDEEAFEEKSLPTRFDLDEVSDNKPVLIVRTCGHIGIANTYALKTLNLLDKPHLIKGVEVDSSGKPIGVLKEQALGYVLNKAITMDKRIHAKLIYNVLNELAAYGLVMVSSMNVKQYEFDTLRTLTSLPIRVRIFYDKRHLDNILNTVKNVDKNSYLKVLGIKALANGSFGGRTAALREPYSDDRENYGKLLLNLRDLKELLNKTARTDLMLAIHAIGDKALEETIKAYSNLKLASFIRIEHASLIPPDLMEKLVQYPPYAIVVQPRFRISDWWLKKRLGHRVKWVYPFRTLLNKRILVAASSDAPVEPFDPLKGIEAAISDKGFGERIPVEGAVKMYTINAAKALKENNVGMLKKGFRGDIVVLNKDIFKNNIRDLRVEATIVEGKIVYKR